MKKKIVFICVLLILIILGIVLIIIKNKPDNIQPKEKKEEYKIVRIEYSYGGGFGTEIDASAKTITITSNGNVLFTNDYDSSKKESKISDEKYKELNDYISDHISLFKGKVKEDKRVADGYSSHLEIELEDGTKYKIGGYMVSNKEYNKIIDLIFKAIDKDEFYKYVDNIGK